MYRDIDTITGIVQIVITLKDVKAPTNKFNGIIQAIVLQLKEEELVVAENALVHGLLSDRKKELAPATRKLLDGVAYPCGALRLLR